MYIWFIYSEFTDVYKEQLVLTCNEKTRSAGMGMIAAAKNANMLLSEVRRMLSPVLLSTTPVCSCLDQ
jgi:hypothetical protein